MLLPRQQFFYQPPFCQPIQDSWLFPKQLPSCHLMSCFFEVNQLQEQDFKLKDITTPKGSQKRQAEFLAARHCAQYATQRISGVFEAPATGKVGEPIWPNGIVGSITHSHSWAAALTGDAQSWRGLGIDRENLLNSERAQRLAKTILTHQELKHLHTLPINQQAWLITLSFSLKESAFKALYPLTQQFFYWQDIMLTHYQEGFAELSLLRNLNSDWKKHSTVQGQYSYDTQHLLSLISISR